MCVGCVADAIEADTRGVDRLEISSALEVDGVSPSVGLVETVLERVRTPLVVLIRSRSGDFVYESSDVDLMVRDAHRYASMGVAGVAIGALRPDGQLDEAALTVLVEAAKTGNESIDLVCHRAFDATSDPEASLTVLSALGFNRVLTSGGASSAQQGAATIRSWQASTSLELVPAGGIRSDTVRSVAAATGCRSVHGTFRAMRGGDSCIRLDPIELEAAMVAVGRTPRQRKPI